MVRPGNAHRRGAALGTAHRGRRDEEEAEEDDDDQGQYKHPLIEAGVSWGFDHDLALRALGCLAAQQGAEASELTPQLHQNAFLDVCMTLSDGHGFEAAAWGTRGAPSGALTAWCPGASCAGARKSSAVHLRAWWWCAGRSRQRTHDEDGDEEEDASTGDEGSDSSSGGTQSSHGGSTTADSDSGSAQGTDDDDEELDGGLALWAEEEEDGGPQLEQGGGAAPAAHGVRQPPGFPTAHALARGQPVSITLDDDLEDNGLQHAAVGGLGGVPQGPDAPQQPIATPPSHEQAPLASRSRLALQPPPPTPPGGRAAAGAGAGAGPRSTWREAATPQELQLMQRGAAGGGPHPGADPAAGAAGGWVTERERQRLLGLADMVNARCVLPRWRHSPSGGVDSPGRFVRVNRRRLAFELGAGCLATAGGARRRGRW